MTRARLDRAPVEVAAMFDRVAPRYDLVNDLLSMGQDRRWRRAVVRAAAPVPGEVGLDLAAGTGTSTLPLRAAGARVVACDFSLGMLRVGAARQPTLPFVAGDALRLPFRPGVFDLVTISFGLRNVADLDAALREMARVTRTGGRLVVCEFTQPAWAPWRAVYRGYLRRLLPAVARLAASNPAAYEYLSESILAWPDRTALGERIAAAGWSTVTWQAYSGGIVALHHAVRPPTP